jgi:hypothetical protein
MKCSGVTRKTWVDRLSPLKCTLRDELLMLFIRGRKQQLFVDKKTSTLYRAQIDN